MRHRKAGVKLNRNSSHRQAMFRNMVTSLFKHDRIRTTDTKAKELRRWADHIITLAKRGDLHSRRLALAIVREKNIVHKVFDEVEDRFGKVSGGYTRIIKLGRRPGDAAQVSLIELIGSDDVADKPTKKKPKKDAVKQEGAQEQAKEENAVEAETAASPSTEASPSVETASSEASESSASSENETEEKISEDSTNSDPEKDKKEE